MNPFARPLVLSVQASRNLRTGEPNTNDDAGLNVPAADRPTYADRPDAELIRLLQVDDLDAFEAFFHRHQTFIYRTAYGLTGDRDVAEEVLQDTFVRAYRHRAALRDDVSPVPWLHRVALNLCYSRLVRKRLRIEPIGPTDEQVGDRRDEPQAWAERAELARTVRTAVGALPPGQRSVVVLRYLHGMSLQETSTVLRIRPGTVKSRLHYALRRLRVVLSPQEESGDGRPGTLPADASERQS